MFEAAATNDCLLAIDYLLTLPTLPNELIDAVYLYITQGEQTFIKRRILDFVNQRGLVDELAKFMIDQYMVPVHSVWKTAFPDLRRRKKMGALLHKAGDSPPVPFSYAFNCVKDLTAAFRTRYCDAFPEDQLFIRAKQIVFKNCSDSEMTEAIARGSFSTMLATRDEAHPGVLLATSAVDKAGRIFLLEFTKRQSVDPCFLRFDFGGDDVYHLQFFA